ncbi:MAG: hypothetical protein HC835_07390 [Oscillatoriales cyanobacterium RM2_1_1]|nr:hypothetical protein [Oscillatoriales cyanobacterium SM2_3_0]NJO45461.1 hypothetical protein [Oscillatoriales cyanobacterium RM2_1_1]
MLNSSKLSHFKAQTVRVQPCKKSYRATMLLQAVLTALMLGSGSVRATTFTGSSAGLLQLPEGTFGASLSSENSGTNNRITWGDPTPDSFRNYLQYDGVGFTTEIDQLFPLGEIEYRNGEVFTGSHNLDASNFPLAIELSFLNPLTATNTFNYRFSLLQTLNQTGDPVLDADTLSFAADGVSTDTFNFEGTEYTLQLVGFSNDGGSTILEEFVLPEEATVNALLYAQLTAAAQESTPIPEPGLLVGIGLLGVYLSGTRFKRR